MVRHGSVLAQGDAGRRTAGAEDALRRSEERFGLLVDAVEEYAIFMLDPDGVVMSWNAGARRIKGYAADEIVGHKRLQGPPEGKDFRDPAEGLRVQRHDALRQFQRRGARNGV